MNAMAKTKSSATGRLAGKVALITGAAGNLGGSIVRRYLAEGATVVMSGRDAARTQAALDAAVSECRTMNGNVADQLAVWAKLELRKLDAYVKD